MKKNSTIMLLLLLVSVYSQILGTVHWHGNSTPNVLDENLEITSHEVSLGHITKIRAIAADVEVTLKKDTEIEGQSNSILFLEADFGRTILFKISHKLEFEDVLVIQYGLGTVEFEYDNGEKVILKQGKHDIGTQWWIVMDEAVAGQAPTLHFTRSSTNQSEHDYLTIRSKSLISFLGSESNSNQTGRVWFTPTNEGAGRFVLDIHDKGAFLVAGHKTTQSDPKDIRQDDIDRTTPAAGNPVFEIDNLSVSGLPSNLLVLNENNTWYELLIDPFYNLNTRDPLTNYTGVFDGIRYGFVLGAASTTLIQPNTYLDYVGLALNQDIEPHIPGALPDVMRSLIKQRNPSALVVDGSFNPIFANRPAEIIFAEQAALVLRSGVSEDGTVLDLDAEAPFTVLPDETTFGAGNWVLDVEGELRTSGSSVDTNKIEVLSLFVEPTGGQLLIGNTGFPIFPLRTFATEPFSNSFEQYNKGAILVNNAMKLDNVTLEHTDFNHTVIQCDDVNSEPTYVGGETYTLNPISDEYGFVELTDVTLSVPRPSIQFKNSVFNIHTSVASTGVDFVVTTAVVDNIGSTNFSSFVFFNNGPEVDNGTGRQWIMGTLVGSKAENNSTIINSDSHLDIIQNEDFIDVGEEIAQQLTLSVAANTEDIVPVVGNTSKKSIQTLYLGWNSNISIGTNADSTGFLNDVNPILLVDDNYFSFDSRGGSTKQPAETGVTGEGGIFVDLNGIFDFNNQIIVSFNATVTKSRNGLILLNKRQVFFNFFTGISTWKPDMSNQTILVSEFELLAEYTLNWIDIKKDYSQFTPYEVGDVTICECPPVLEENVTAIPTIQGTIDQLQIQGTRIGDPVHILFDRCNVRETIFYNSGCAAEAPVGVYVLRNDARVGIGCADQNVVSDYATTMLGVNGIQIIVDNGSGFIYLNEDIYINNICSILKGPNFVSGVDRLRISSSVPREIRIKPEGVLDLSDFDNAGDVIEILGDVRIVLEPGSSIIFGGGMLLFNDDTQLIFEPSPLIFDDINNIPLGPIDNTLSPTAIVPADEPHNEFAALTGFGFDLQNTNPYRVRLIGEGTLALTGNAQAFIPNGAIVGVETLLIGECEIPTTNLRLLLQQSSKFHVGRVNPIEGGALQVGNVLDNGLNHSITFTLEVNGEDAIFEVGPLGFLGAGVGFSRPILSDGVVLITPSQSLINTTFNVSAVNFLFLAGNFDVSRIYDTDDPRSSVFAINNDPAITYTVDYALPIDLDAEQQILRADNFTMYGGGNFVKVSPGEGSISPIVRTDNGQSPQPRMEVGLTASTDLQDVQEPEVIGDGDFIFETLRSLDATDNERPNQFARVNIAEAEDSFKSVNTAARLGGIIGDEIVRSDAFDVAGPSDTNTNKNDAIEEGAVFAIINANPATPQFITVSNVRG